MYVHFVTRVERPLLEQFAQDLQLSNSVSSVSKIYDQYLDIIALEPSLFTLNIKDSLISYNEPSLSEIQIRYEYCTFFFYDKNIFLCFSLFFEHIFFYDYFFILLYFYTFLLYFS